MHRFLTHDIPSPALSRAGSTMTDIRRMRSRPLTIADAYEFFKKPPSVRRFSEIDAVAKYICEFDYFKRLRNDHNFLAVKECVSFMQYEYSPPGRVSPM
mmetsp:Transcript_8389/g.16681  ORF Transcript_8389/g.16681 Transcript_8389/m.16681 type:complete len:99 (+) Transcript_8389:8032-8328(+)